MDDRELLQRMIDGYAADVADLEAALAPASFIGRAPQQVDEFLEEVVAPLLAGVAAGEGERAEVRV